MFSEKATKIDEIFTIDLTLGSKCQIDGEDFIDFCGLLKKHELEKGFDRERLILNTVEISLYVIKWIYNIKKRKYIHF